MLRWECLQGVFHLRPTQPNPAHAMRLATCAQADSLTGEVEGVFVTRQLSSDDMGARDPDEVQIEGVWYAQLQS